MFVLGVLRCNISYRVHGQRLFTRDWQGLHSLDNFILSFMHVASISQTGCIQSLIFYSTQSAEVEKIFFSKHNNNYWASHARNER